MWLTLNCSLTLCRERRWMKDMYPPEMQTIAIKCRNNRIWMEKWMDGGLRGGLEVITCNGDAQTSQIANRTNTQICLFFSNDPNPRRLHLHSNESLGVHWTFHQIFNLFSFQLTNGNRPVSFVLILFLFFISHETVFESDEICTHFWLFPFATFYSFKLIVRFVSQFFSE